MASEAERSLVGIILDGRYQISESIGEGGATGVFRARQLNVDRDVAVKVLDPRNLAAEGVPDAVERFEAEARIISKLRHPHTIKLFDFGKMEDGRLYLVMEFVHGQPLDKFLQQGPLDERRTLRIIRQVSEALAEAHSQGIIHRDLKPANICIEQVGGQEEVKVLDFGIAKVAAQPFKTAAGMVFGTPAYMSPEQAQGLPVDARSDLYSLGVIAYHCLTGRLPFEADTPVGLLVKTVNDPPPAFDALKSEVRVSAGFEKLILKMLSKHPEDRPSSAANVRDAVLALEHPSMKVTESPLPSPGVESARKHTFRLLTWVLGFLVLAGAAGYALYSRFGSPQKPEEGLPASPQVSVAQFTELPGMESQPAFSPDGKFLVYVGDATGKSDIYLQRIGGDRPLNLTAELSGDQGQPSFSPDGSQIAFVSVSEGGALRLMGATGEPGRKIADQAFNPAWSPDGKEILFATKGSFFPYARQGTSVIRAIELATGRRRQLTPDSVRDAMQPSVSPHGKRVAYWALGEHAQRDIWTIGIDGTAPVQVTNDDAVDFNPVWSPDGSRLYFLSDRSGARNLWRVAIDESTGKVLGEPEGITAGAANLEGFAISNTGIIAYTQSIERYSINHVLFDPIKEAVEGAPNVIFETSRSINYLDLSADGKHLVYATGEIKEDLFLISVDGSGRVQLTNDSFRNRGPRFSPDGKTIAYYSNRSDWYQIFAIQVDGSGPRQVTDSSGAQSPENSGAQFPLWSPDGRRIVVVEINDLDVMELTQWDIGPEVSAQKMRTLAGTRLPGKQPIPTSWSPDDTRIAGHLVDIESGATKCAIFVYSMRDARLDLMTDFGHSVLPVWLNDSQRLLFLTDTGYNLLDTKTRKSHTVIKLPERTAAGSISISRDNRDLYYLSNSASIDLWLLTLKE